MPSFERHKTKYPGVYYIIGTSDNGKPERIYYIYYRKDGKQIEEKAGRQFKDNMTPAQAHHIRSLRTKKKESSNKERRQFQAEEKQRTLNHWSIDRLWVEYKSNNPSNKSLYVDDLRYTKYIKQKFGDKEPSSLLKFEIEKYKNDLLNDKKNQRKPQTVKHVLSLLIRIINSGVKNGYCSPLAFHIELPKVNNMVKDFLSSEQITNLFNAIEQEPDIQIANIMKIAIFTGMRRGEILRLQWNDIKITKGNNNTMNGYAILRNPKGGVDQTIPLSVDAIQIFLNHPKTSSPFVFPDSNGNQRTQINHQANRIKKRAGLPPSARPMQDLRHNFASILASDGVPLYTIQRLLTHKSPVMTQRYAHLSPSAQKDAANRAGDLIKQIISQSSLQSK